MAPANTINFLQNNMECVSFYTRISCPTHSVPEHRGTRFCESWGSKGFLTLWRQTIGTWPNKGQPIGEKIIVMINFGCRSCFRNVKCLEFLSGNIRKLLEMCVCARFFFLFLLDKHEHASRKKKEICIIVWVHWWFNRRWAVYSTF